jgi:hypothetical protein
MIVGNKLHFPPEGELKTRQIFPKELSNLKQFAQLSMHLSSCCFRLFANSFLRINIERCIEKFEVLEKLLEAFSSPFYSRCWIKKA